MVCKKDFHDVSDFKFLRRSICSLRSCGRVYLQIVTNFSENYITTTVRFDVCRQLSIVVLWVGLSCILLCVYHFLPKHC
jgi:hypothetical protein